MFSMRGVSPYKFKKLIVRERKRMYSPMFNSMNVEEMMMQTICYSDPYALMTVTNSPIIMCRSVLYRLVSELFFDQQAHIFVHSSDLLSCVGLILVLYMKLNLLREDRYK